MTLWRAFTAWTQLNAGLIAMAAVLALIVVGWNVRSSYDSEQALHASDCASSRTRFLDVTAFWNNKAATHGNHSAHEEQASKLWSDIAGHMSRAKFDPVLITDVSKVSDAWVDLKNDDDNEAKLDGQYVQLLTRDYNRNCGSPPTPLPVAAPVTSP